MHGFVWPVADFGVRQLIRTALDPKKVSGAIIAFLQS